MSLFAARTDRSATALASTATAARDERAAFDAVYREHKAYVWHTLRRLGVAERDCTDLVHDVFVVFWRRRADLEDGRPVKPWLFGIAHRVVLGHRRKRGRRPEDPSDDVDARVEPAQDAVIDKKRAEALLARALARMDLDQRAVFVLHDVDGENVAACARALDVSVNTLYSRLRLARKRLADVVQEARAGKEGVA